MTEKRKRHSANFGFYFNSDILKRFRCSLPKTVIGGTRFGCLNCKK